MRQARTGILDLPGTDIYYEVRGAGPGLLLIPTGNGDATPYGPMADILAEHYTVYSYDRRGFSRSAMHQPMDNTRRVPIDVGDARDIIERLIQAPAHVFGSSSGAITALALLERQPGHVAVAVSHEPPLASALPDAQRWLRFYEDLYATYRREGVDAARTLFRSRMGMAAKTRPPDWAQLPQPQLQEMLARIRVNQAFWFEHEVPTYPSYVPDYQALKSVSDRLVLAGGIQSRGHWPYRPNTAIAERVGLDIVDFPGGHVGHVTHPCEFADQLRAVLP